MFSEKEMIICIIGILWLFVGISVAYTTTNELLKNTKKYEVEHLDEIKITILAYAISILIGPIMMAIAFVIFLNGKEAK